MPRKPTLITSEYPYHIVARSNNKDWFYLPMEKIWSIFQELLIKSNQKFNFKTHAFVLMNNHYHLIGTASKEFPLPKVMEWFQRSANRVINDEAGRINHLFGGPYRSFIIKNELNYFHVLKYIFRNPVHAGVVKNVEDYLFSTLNSNQIPILKPENGIDSLIPKTKLEILLYLNTPYSESSLSLLKKCIKKTDFKFPKRIDDKTRTELFYCR